MKANIYLQFECPECLFIMKSTLEPITGKRGIASCDNPLCKNKGKRFLIPTQEVELKEIKPKKEVSNGQS